MTRSAPAPMTRARFTALAAAWGADPDRWPEPERERARSFRRTHPDAEAILAGERTLDRRLSEWIVPPPPPFLAGAIAARALSRRPLAHRFRAWFVGGAATVALASGLTAGIAIAAFAPAPAPSHRHVSALYGSPLLGLGDVDAEPGPDLRHRAGDAAPDPS